MLYGTIIGDICGSPYEGEKNPIISYDKKIYATITDDTVCTLAIANAIITKTDYAKSLRDICNKYPEAGYGRIFKEWLKDPSIGPYNSYANGSAMRVSPIAWAFDNENDILEEAKKSAEVTHNHPDAIKGAQNIALAIFKARMGASKEEIIDFLSSEYKLRTYAYFKKKGFLIKCKDTIEVVMSIFNESDAFDECIYKAIALGGDTDTNAAIVGSLAEAYWEVPEHVEIKARSYLPDPLLEILDTFNDIYS